jgi:hypothetical protein
VTDDKPYDQEQDDQEQNQDEPFLLDPDDEHVGHPSPDETVEEEEDESE